MKHLLYLSLFFVILFSCTDDEGVHFQPDTFYLNTDTPTVNEADGIVTISFHIAKTFANDINISFELSGTSEVAVDYNIPNQNITIPAGELTATLTIDLIDDTIIEDQENIILTVISASNSNLYIDDSDTITITIIDDESNAFQNSVLISNYGNPTSTITYVNNDFTVTEQQIYNTVNTEIIGSGLQSIGFNGTKAYLVSSIDNQIIVVNRNSFLKESTISTTLNTPRHFAASGTKGYVTNWGDTTISTDDFIAVIDLSTNTIETTIAVDEKPEKILAKNGKIYIAHSGSVNNLSIINTADNSLSTVTLPGNMLSDMVIDSANNLWILAEGNPATSGMETSGKLILYTIADGTFSTIDFATTEHPNNLTYSNGTLYYSLNDAVYALDETESTLPVTPIITTISNDISVNEDRLYTLDIDNSINNGSLTIFNLTDNTPIQTINTGIVPNGIYFN